MCEDRGGVVICMVGFACPYIHPVLFVSSGDDPTWILLSSHINIGV